MAIASAVDRVAAARRRGTFDRIVVPVEAGGEGSFLAVEAAARVASDSATVLLACVLEVPLELPLDALFPDEEEAARAALRRAAALVEAHGVHAVQRLERGYSVPPLVLELAEEHDAELIVIASPNRARRGRSAFGPTATAVLHRATCRVLLISPKPILTLRRCAAYATVCARRRAASRARSAVRP